MAEMARKSPRLRHKIVRDPQKSRITNGKLLPGIIDERSGWCRRAKDIISEYIEGDLAGVDNTSAAERSLVRRIAVITTELEMLEAKFATDGHASTNDLDLYIRGSGGLRRLLEALTSRMPRRSRDVTPPSIEQYAQHVRERSEAPA
jgi:hypothetical protein